MPPELPKAHVQVELPLPWLEGGVPPPPLIPLSEMNLQKMRDIWGPRPPGWGEGIPWPPPHPDELRQQMELRQQQAAEPAAGIGCLQAEALRTFNRVLDMGKGSK